VVGVAPNHLFGVFPCGSYLVAPGGKGWLYVGWLWPNVPGALAHRVPMASAVPSLSYGGVVAHSASANVQAAKGHQAGLPSIPASGPQTAALTPLASSRRSSPFTCLLS